MRLGFRDTPRVPLKEARGVFALTLSTNEPHDFVLVPFISLRRHIPKDKITEIVIRLGLPFLELRHLFGLHPLTYVSTSVSHSPPNLWVFALLLMVSLFGIAVRVLSFEVIPYATVMPVARQGRQAFATQVAGPVTHLLRQIMSSRDKLSDAAKPGHLLPLRFRVPLMEMVAPCFTQLFPGHRPGRDANLILA